MTQILGIASVVLNGVTLNSEPGASFDPGGSTKDTETTDQKSSWIDKLRPAKVMCKIKVERGVSVADLNDITNATVQFIADTGQSYVLYNAWRVGELSASGAQNGGIDLEFNANESIEVGV